MRKEEKYAGWRPRYKGVIDAEGYRLEHLAIDDPDFPELISNILRQRNVKSRHFITPISGKWKEKLIENSREQPYLDFLNLECGANTLRKVERFVNTYGFSYKIEKPSSDARRWLSVDELLSFSRLLRDRTGQMLDGKRTGLLPCTHLEWMQHAYIFIDLDTKEFVYETSDMTQFALLQIADVISRGLTLANCDVCGAYMTPSRSTRAYCGGTCRKRANRQKTSPAFRDLN
jgi:hypothetical protein